MSEQGGRGRVRGRVFVLVSAVALATVVACGGGGNKLPDLTPFPPDLEVRLHSIRDLASEVRGLPVNEDTDEGLITPDAYRQYVEEVMGDLDDDERLEMDAFETALRIMHLIGPDDGLMASLTQDQSENVLGFYVPEENRLALIGEDAALDGEDDFILTHEYVHSFQHAAFDIEALHEMAEAEENGEGPTDYGTTISCLTEGDASLSSFLYAEEVFGPDWYDIFDDSPSSDADVDDIPPALQRYFSFNYLECVYFATYLHDEGGWDAINEAYEDPPSTQEQILHPEKYLSHEEATNLVPVDLSDQLEQLDQGWQRLDLSQFGEFDVYNYLLTITEDWWAAPAAAEGWGAGWIGVYNTKVGNASEPQDVLVHIALGWDSPEDFLEFMTVYEGVIETVSEGRWELLGLHGPTRWGSDGEYGYVEWNEASSKVHVILATDEEALEVATGALPP